MSGITLESLIEEQRKRIGTLRFNNISWQPYYDYEDGAGYEKWVESAKRFIGLNYPGDKSLSCFEDESSKPITRKGQENLLAILEALKDIPVGVSSSQDNNTVKKDEMVNVTINNTNTQSQSQQQDLFVNVLIGAIKNELTAQQMEELKEVMAEGNNDAKKTLPKLVEKLKSFGFDVVSNILANLVVEPNVWKMLLL